jgi:hypothetical protein
MWWIPLMTAALQAKGAAQKRAHQEQFNKGQAEANKYSPWTGMNNSLDNSYTPDALSAGAAGYMQGMSIDQSLSGAANGASGAAGAVQPTAGQFMDQAQMAQGGMPMTQNQNPALYGNPWDNVA